MLRKCWDAFIDDVSGQPGRVKVTNALTGDIIKAADFTGEDCIHAVQTLMLKHVSLPAASLLFTNTQHITLSAGDMLKDISSRRTPPLSVPFPSTAQKVMIVTW